MDLLVFRLQFVAKPFYAICWQFQTYLDFRPVKRKHHEQKQGIKFEIFQSIITKTGSSLQRLNLSGAISKNFSAPEFIQLLTRRAPLLSSLKLKYCDLNFLCSQFSELSQLTNLRELHLGQHPNTQNRYLFFSLLTVLTTLSSLQTLNLNSALKPEDFSLLGLMDLASTLTSLSLADNGIDTHNMQSFQIFTRLTKLNISLNRSNFFQFLTNLVFSFKHSFPSSTTNTSRLSCDLSFTFLCFVVSFFFIEIDKFTNFEDWISLIRWFCYGHPHVTVDIDFVRYQLLDTIDSHCSHTTQNAHLAPSSHCYWRH